MGGVETIHNPPFVDEHKRGVDRSDFYDTHKAPPALFLGMLDLTFQTLLQCGYFVLAFSLGLFVHLNFSFTILR